MCNRTGAYLISLYDSINQRLIITNHGHATYNNEGTKLLFEIPVFVRLAKVAAFARASLTMPALNSEDLGFIRASRGWFNNTNFSKMCVVIVEGKHVHLGDSHFICADKFVVVRE